ncbi:MAG: helix-hairpin-helix domain-containing protein [Anaerolineales bacterium]|jgi:competence protein ComEA|nr:helix-hairpin-helix domain-containing protein [Anaerolineales bacterium]
MKNALFVLLGVMAGFVLAGLLVFVSRAPAGQPIVLQPAPTKAPIAVHVIGAVPRPGLYEFAEGARVQDAIDASGGLLSTANINAVNLAALLTDGQQLNIPYKSGSEPTEDDTALELPGTISEEEPGGAIVTETGGDLININTASLEELDTLPGIGPTIAQRIIDYRQQNGAFSTIEEIMEVSGIGPSTFDNIKDFITVN